MPTTRDIFMALYAAVAPVGDHTHIDDLSSVVEVNVPVGATRIMMQSRVKSVRFTLDGTDPTSSLGFILLYEQGHVILPIKGCRLKFIQQTASAEMDYQFLT